MMVTYRHWRPKIMLSTPLSSGKRHRLKTVHAVCHYPIAYIAKDDTELLTLQPYLPVVVHMVLEVEPRSLCI